MATSKIVPAERLEDMQRSLDMALRALTAAQNDIEMLSRAGHHDAAAKGMVQVRGAMQAWARLLDALERRLLGREQRQGDDTAAGPILATAFGERVSKRDRAKA